MTAYFWVCFVYLSVILFSLPLSCMGTRISGCHIYEVEPCRCNAYECCRSLGGLLSERLGQTRVSNRPDISVHWFALLRTWFFWILFVSRQKGFAPRRRAGYRENMHSHAGAWERGKEIKYLMDSQGYLKSISSFPHDLSGNPVRSSNWVCSIKN